MQTDQQSIGLKAVVAVGAILMGATLSLTFIQVILRTFFNNPQAWAEEVSRYLFVWVVFLGVAVAAFRDNHIRLDIIDHLLAGRKLRMIKIFQTLIESFAVSLLLYSGILVAWRNRDSSFYTIPSMPQVVFYLSVPVCSLFILWFLIRRLRTKTIN